MDEIFKEGGLYYKVTNHSPFEVQVHLPSYGWGANDVPKGEFQIPATVVHEGIEYSVKTIGGTAFRYGKEITAVTVPNSMTRVAT